MQRQSLGGSSSSSPSSKLHPCEENDEEEKKRRLVVITDSDIDDEDQLAKKKNHHHRSCSIHLIPVLTIFCILILYLVSYDPSQKEVDISDFRRDGVLEINSHRSLHGIHKDANNKKSRFHRKIGDF